MMSLERGGWGCMPKDDTLMTHDRWHGGGRHQLQTPDGEKQSNYNVNLCNLYRQAQRLRAYKI